MIAQKADMKRLLTIFILILFSSVMAQGQGAVLQGLVTDSLQNAITGVNILNSTTQKGTSTDEAGRFSLEIEAGSAVQLILSHVRYRDDTVTVRSEEFENVIKFVLIEESQMLDQIEIGGDRFETTRQQVSTVELNPIEIQSLPTPFQDISKILVTLPGVSSVNEFSTGYSVRGGNYDENLVYVNNMPVYRPFIIRAGQQEGLSFANPDLVTNLEFSSGGWQSKYGDGLASALNVQYKKPTKYSGSLSIGLLGGSAHVEGASKNDRINFIVGARHKRSEYLLNTLETNGEYKPTFTDVQSWVNFDLTKKGKSIKKTELGVLFAYANNNYSVIPESRETTFGTFSQQLRLYVGFIGQERMEYDTYQGGLKLTHWFSSRIRSEFLLSSTRTFEREYFDVESGYRLCNVDTDPGSSTFDKCLVNLGIGTQGISGRNMLDATLTTLENRNSVIINDQNTFEFGLGYTLQNFDDQISDYVFVDSADFVTVEEAVQTTNQLTKNNFHAYVQNTTEIASNQQFTAGLRMQYLDMNKQWLFSPRIQYSISPKWRKDIMVNFAAGLYQQPPFYREMRNSEGNLNTDLKAQSSVHGIFGIDYNFSAWNRPFKITTEVYYKYLWNVVPYDINNVRIRYFAENSAVAYAAGIDFRISGEFIPGEESWFSLGVLSTKEDLEDDTRGYIPRPSDQLINLNIFFQDHLPINPTYKMHLNLFFATGLPFSPPGDLETRNSFRGPVYQRIDIGFSKMIFFNKKGGNNPLSSLWIRAEILNLTAHQNVISYYWVKDVNGTQYAVPNSLSARFLNLRLTANF